MIQAVLAPVIVFMAIAYAIYQLLVVVNVKSGQSDESTCSGCYGSCHATRELIKNRRG
jgi:hypothetical protein